MKIVYWFGVFGFSLLPLNFIISIAGKVWHGERMTEEDLIGFAVALFGAIAATVFSRELLAKRVDNRGARPRSD